MHVVYEFHERQFMNSRGDLLSCSQRPPLLQSSSNNITEESSSLKHPSSLQSFADIPTHFSYKDQTLEIEGGLSGL